MRNVHRIVTSGLLAGSLTVGLTAVAATSGAATKVSHGSSTACWGQTSAKCTFNVPFGVNDHSNFIFPFASGAYFTVTNLNDFQEPMFRPLYWFGKGSDIAVQYALSPANAPVFSNGNKTITITMKGWKFSNGEPVDARSVMFFLNMYNDIPFRYAGYVPGFGIPDEVANAYAANSSTVVINMKSAVNPNWYLYNFLSEITPMPLSWDKVHPGDAAGSANCGASTPPTSAFSTTTGSWNNNANMLRCAANTSSSAAKSVPSPYSMLRNASLDLASYSTNPLWQAADGPWKLKSFSATGNVVLVANPAYSGPQKAQFGQIVFHPFASLDAEKAALEAGQLDSGYVRPTDLTTAPKPGVPGTNKLSQLSNFNVRTGGTWSFNYAYYNYNSGQSGTHLVNQLYIRQALQDGINQLSIVKALYNGYGVPTYGPIPSLPANGFSKGVGNPYPYSIAAGQKLLKNNGWTGGTCTKASGCGAGVPKGTKLNLTYIYSAGSPTLDAQMAAEKAAWASEGINVTLSAQDANAVASLCTAGSSDGTPTGPNGNWQICQYGGWLYAPDFYPSGELLFQTGALSNPGEYSDAHMDSLITATTLGTAPLNAGYAQYAAQQLPYMYQPTGTGAGELSKAIKGALPVSPLSDFMPEYESK